MGHSQSRERASPDAEEGSPHARPSSARVSFSEASSSAPSALASQSPVLGSRRRRRATSASSSGRGSSESIERHRCKRKLSVGSSLRLGEESQKSKRQNEDGTIQETSATSAMEVDARAESRNVATGSSVQARIGSPRTTTSPRRTTASLPHSQAANSSSSSSSLDAWRHIWDSDNPVASTASGAAATEDTTYRGVTPPVSLDNFAEERERARRQIAQVLGSSASTLPRTDAQTGEVAAADGVAAPPPAEAPVPPSTLSSLLGDVLGIGIRRSAATTGAAQNSTGEPSQTGQQQQATGAQEQQRDSTQVDTVTMSGTSVIVQGALIARTVPSSRRRNTAEPSRRSTDATSSDTVDPASRPPAEARPGGLLRDASNVRMGEGEELQSATLEEQAAMLSRILGIATAATASSLVNPLSSQNEDRMLLQSTLQPAIEQLATGPPRSAPAPPPPAATAALLQPSNIPTGLGQGLRRRLAAFSNRVRSVSGAQPAITRQPASTPYSRPRSTESQEAVRRVIQAARERASSQTANQPDASTEAGQTLWTQMMHAAARQMAANRSSSSGSERASEQATSVPNGHSTGPNDVAGPLSVIREGLPLPPGEPGSFGDFLYNMLRDLEASVQSVRPPGSEQTSPAEGSESGQSGTNLTEEEVSPSTEEMRARRAQDIVDGRLSFFRVFQFEPIAPSLLVPCVVVGVRSLGINESVHGEAGPPPPENTSFTTTTDELPRSAETMGRPPSPSEAGSTNRTDGGEEAEASRYILFVSGGRYPQNHPLLRSSPGTAGHDLMILMELLGTMAAMQSRPSTVTQQQIDSSPLVKYKGSQVESLILSGSVKENTAERCLICLEDWKPEEDCRLMTCQHIFHASCVDQWLVHSSNTCPMCRRVGVAAS